MQNVNDVKDNVKKIQNEKDEEFLNQALDELEIVKSDAETEFDSVSESYFTYMTVREFNFYIEKRFLYDDDDIIAFGRIKLTGVQKTEDVSFLLVNFLMLIFLSKKEKFGKNVWGFLRYSYPKLVKNNIFMLLYLIFDTHTIESITQDENSLKYVKRTMDIITGMIPHLKNVKSTFINFYKKYKSSANYKKIKNFIDDNIPAIQSGWLYNRLRFLKYQLYIINTNFKQMTNKQKNAYRIKLLVDPSIGVLLINPRLTLTTNEKQMMSPDLRISIAGPLKDYYKERREFGENVPELNIKSHIGDDIPNQCTLCGNHTLVMDKEYNLPFCNMECQENYYEFIVMETPEEYK